MQHDTLPQRVTLGEHAVIAQCASLVLAYSRYLFMQYYRAFTRFEAKAFLIEAFRFLEDASLKTFARAVSSTTVIQSCGGGQWQWPRCRDRPRDGGLR
jgi:hypothetical protein